MNIFGKIFSWLIVVLAVTASVLTARMLQVRNSWAKQTTDLKTEYQENQSKLEEQRRQLRQLQEELTRIKLGWNEYWDDVQIDVLDQKAGTIRMTLGTDRGIQQGQTLYVFQPNPAGDGQLFVGPFVVQDARQGQAGLAPAWRFRPGEPDKWSYGSGWRIRESVPTAFLAHFRDLETAFTLSDELLDAKQRYLQAQKDLKQIAQQHLNFRLAELHSTDELRAKHGQIPAQIADGLVLALENEEEARNQVLAEVDKLRRERNAAFEEYERLRMETARLAKQLEKPTPAPATAER